MKLKDIAVAAAFAVATTAALADDQNILLTQTAPNTFSAAFSTSESHSGLFVDNFTFSLPGSFAGALGSGTLSFAALSGPVSLVVASLDATNGVSIATPADADTIAIPSVLAFSGAMAPLTLTVLGFAGDPFADITSLSAGYSGSITFNATVAAVPEPESYALLLAGLAALGIASRRRRDPKTAAG